VLATATAPPVLADDAFDPPEPDALFVPSPRGQTPPPAARAAAPVPLVVLDLPRYDDDGGAEGPPEAA